MNLFGRAEGTSSGIGNTFLCCAEVHGTLVGVRGLVRGVQPGEFCSDSVRKGGGGGGGTSVAAESGLAWACCHSAADIPASIGLVPHRCCCCCSMKEASNNLSETLAAQDPGDHSGAVPRSTSLEGLGFAVATFSNSRCDALFSWDANKACKGLAGWAAKAGVHTGSARFGRPIFVGMFVGMPNTGGGGESIPSSCDTKLVVNGASTGGLAHCALASSSNLGRLELTSGTCGASTFGSGLSGAGGCTSGSRPLSKCIFGGNGSFGC